MTDNDDALRSFTRQLMGKEERQPPPDTPDQAALRDFVHRMFGTKPPKPDPQTPEEERSTFLNNLFGTNEN